ncbi:MAG: serine--tRNA ligase [Nitrospinae bacterium CG11_big_fil_rev_8_21_14_0_20_56_8]|nr:MAG: serine--tRNA ligase [Nitrospinae bacterium CG11_big_fil_rev_8_21_14_0_20_56_8]
MLDIKIFRDNFDSVRASLSRRGDGATAGLDRLAGLDADRRAALRESEGLKNKKKTLSAAVGKLKQQGQDASRKMEEVKTLNVRIKDLDEEVRLCEVKLKEILLNIPNLPDAAIPEGADESANRLVRYQGEKPEFDFKPRDHVELGEGLGILDLKRAAKLSGARFALYRGAGAQLLRGLIQFMLDVHTREHGYEELYPPFLVNPETMTATGQLPKFAEDLFKMQDDDLYLIPTAEVPVTNLHRDEILDAAQLPVKYCAFTPCFRREAGSYGKDTQGLIRQHQFDKVELVKFSRPDRSAEELESLIHDAEAILKKLNLHYRVVELCTGDLGFSAAHTYDLEVWLPGQNAYREISSCSNFTDYQARRGMIRFKEPGGKPELVHTLNGSGLAAGRLFVAVLENYQKSDGTVEVPPALRSYLHGREIIDGKS